MNKVKEYWRRYPNCQICGKPGTPHHIIFKSHGGSDEPKNLITLCQKHHNRAHGIPVYLPYLTVKELLMYKELDKLFNEY